MTRNTHLSTLEGKVLHFMLTASHLQRIAVELEISGGVVSAFLRNQVRCNRKGIGKEQTKLTEAYFPHALTDASNGNLGSSGVRKALTLPVIARFLPLLRSFRIK